MTRYDTNVDLVQHNIIWQGCKFKKP